MKTKTSIISAMEYAGLNFDNMNSDEHNLRFSTKDGFRLRFAGWSEIVFWAEKYVESEKFFEIMNGSSTVLSYSIYQIDLDHRTDCLYPFMGLDFVKSKGGQIDPDNYVCVWRDVVDGSESIFDEVRFMNNLFRTFNLYHPKNYSGRSMSVSDVIVLERDGERTAWYVDTIGFKLLDNFVI